MPSRKAKRPFVSTSKSVSKSKSRSISRNTSSTAQFKANTALFIPIVLLVFVTWYLYRTLFNFPVWFDEIVGKAIFFGLPVMIYVNVTGFTGLAESIRLNKFKTGLLQGIAFGGMFGFAGAIASVLSKTGAVIPVPLFGYEVFWSEFGLAVFTGFWESLFFYGFIMAMIQVGWSHWTAMKQILVTGFIFAVFHIPNVLSQTQDVFSVVGYALLVLAFGIGQAFLFSRDKNLYTLIVVHAIWGMTLLIHTL
jgi:membrane protease YdiL (CAAX protease family)